jgi:hypothetical protein
MPIVNCFIAPGLDPAQTNQQDIIDLWGKEANQSTGHMAINWIRCTMQTGHSYPVMAELSLASLWSAEHISDIQVGLAKALAIYFSLSLEQVFVLTTIVESGRVVDNGREVIW